MPGFFGGFGRTYLTDLTGTDTFNFWINPDAGQDYTLEINLQEDDDGDDAINSASMMMNSSITVSSPQPVPAPSAAAAGSKSPSRWLISLTTTLSLRRQRRADAVPAAVAATANLSTSSSLSSATPVQMSTSALTTGSFQTARWPPQLKSLMTLRAVCPPVPMAMVCPSASIPLAMAAQFPLLQQTRHRPRSRLCCRQQCDGADWQCYRFRGLCSCFENAAVDTWVPQDWSSFEGFSFWLYGQNTGTTVFVDVIDNRNPGSTVDDGERFTVSLVDNFSGWQFFEFPFSTFVRKEIGNGAPNDGFTLTQVHGWALGMLNTPGEVTYYADDVSLYGVAEIPELAVTFASANYDIDEGTTGNIVVKLNRPMNSDDPAQVTVDYFTEPVSHPRT